MFKGLNNPRLILQWFLYGMVAGFGIGFLMEVAHPGVGMGIFIAVMLAYIYFVEKQSVNNAEPPKC